MINSPKSIPHIHEEVVSAQENPPPARPAGPADEGQAPRRQAGLRAKDVFVLYG